MDGFLAVAGVADDLEAGIGGECQSEGFCEQVVVVGDENADRRLSCHAT
jgi:hypothetical protein